MMSIRTRIALFALLGFLAMDASVVSAQATFTACRVPDVGAIYMIGVPGAPGACLDPGHVEFSWTEGGGSVGPGDIGTTELADGAVTPPKIATDESWDFGGPDGKVRFFSTLGEIGQPGTTLLASLFSDIWSGPQLRFNGVDTGFWDIGLDGVGNYVIEFDSSPECTLFSGAGWDCPSYIPPDAVGSTEILDNSIQIVDIQADAVGDTQLGLEIVTVQRTSLVTQFDNVTVPCPVGKRVISGGYWLSANFGPSATSTFTTVNNSPSTDTQWQVVGYWPAAQSGGWSWEVYAVCIIDS